MTDGCGIARYSKFDDHSCGFPEEVRSAQFTFSYLYGDCWHVPRLVASRALQFSVSQQVGSSGCATVTPLLNRQQVLLALLDTLGGRSWNRNFQELLFLFTQEHPAAGLYEFVPCKYGAFSFTSYADRRELV